MTRWAFELILFQIILSLFSTYVYAVEQLNEPILPIPFLEITDPDVVSLGEKLFNDARFSSDGTVSCASCHILTKGGVDNLTTSPGVENRQGKINTPTVFNSSLNIKQFWDGRAATLFDQAEGPIMNSVEMNSNWSKVIQVIKQDPQYIDQFNASFPDGITVNNIKKSIVRFEESLLTPNSRFDKYLRGDVEAITQDELRGYTLFKQYGCVSCHQGVAVGGNMFQKLGIMEEYFTKNLMLKDLGRFNATKREEDRFVFKVPTLRNIALTAPYLHDGSAKTLEDVVEVMMIYQLGIKVDNSEIELIVAFLKTLTGEYNGKPL